MAKTKKERHSLYESWRWTARVKEGRVPEWNDFQTFCRDVGDRPSKFFKLKRKDIREPFGPTNVEWVRTKYPGARRDLAKYQRQWRKDNPKKVKNYDLKRGYGIDLEQYNKLLELQGGACAICKKSDVVLCIDHDHTTDEIRGLLCNLCNRALGLLKDSSESLKRAETYLTNPPARTILGGEEDS